MTNGAEIKDSGSFLQGFAVGFCLALDILRDRGMNELPDKFGAAMIIFADETEASLKGGPVGELLAHSTTPELRRSILNQALMQYQGQPADRRAQQGKEKPQV